MNLDAGGYGFIRGIIASAGSYLTPPKTPFEDYLREARDAEDIAYQEQLTVWQTSEAAA